MKRLNIGMIGTGFMAKAHSRAYVNMQKCFYPPPAKLCLKVIAGINKEVAQEAARRFGFEEARVGWESVVEDKSTDVVSVLTPNNLHKEICDAALKSGKHVICEKPLATNAVDAKEMYEVAKSSGVKHLVAYSYRRTPAVVLAKKLIEEGAIGEIRNFRGYYLSDWAKDSKLPMNWRFQSEVAGPGALGDTGSHVIDLARYLVGDIREVSAVTRTWITERYAQQGVGHKKRVENDDDASFLLKFRNGAIGTIQTSRVAFGRNNYITFEVNGSLGSLFFNYESLDELYYYDSRDPEDRQGFRRIVTGPPHPYGKFLWPISKLGIGFVETKIIEIHDFVKAIVEGEDVKPDFYDGWKVCEVVDAVLKSAESGKWCSV